MVSLMVVRLTWASFTVCRDSCGPRGGSTHALRSARARERVVRLGRRGPARGRGGAQPLSTMARCATAIDSHVHVWLRREDCEPGDRFFEFAEGQTPTVCATPSALLAEMDDAGIDGALIVQPINYKFDHAFVQNTIASNKQRFMGCLLADPSAGMDGIAKMEELAATGCFRFVRFNPYLFPNTPSDGKGGMSGAVGRALYKKAGELSLPVGVMAFRGIIPLEEDINALMKEAPDTKMVHLIVGNHPKPEQFGHLRSIALHCIASFI